MRYASEWARTHGAPLTLVRTTTGVEIFGPGGSPVLPVWKEAIVGYATQEIAKLQEHVGTNAEVIIESGDLHEQLNRAARQTKGDLLVIGHMPSSGHWGPADAAMRSVASRTSRC
ncbi:MAG: universal stress protein [Candidatus Acidiferrum sp.]